MSTTQQLRSFNDAGLRSYLLATERYLADTNEPDPTYLMFEDTLAIPHSAGVVERRGFSDRYELAKYLHPIVAPTDGSQFRPERGVMDWLACFYFSTLTSASNGTKLGEVPRYVLSADFRNAYRHLIAGPLETYALSGESASLLLAGSAVDTPGDAYEQLASRREIRTNRGVMDAAHRLYFDDEKGARKRGATSTGGRGSIRRFIQLIQQLDLTYDIYGMSGEEILGLLPSEFDSWISR